MSNDFVRWDGFSLTLPLFFAFVIASALSLAVTLALSFLLYVQIKSVWKNETAIEEYIGKTSLFLSEALEDSVFHLIYVSFLHE